MAHLLDVSGIQRDHHAVQHLADETHSMDSRRWLYV